MEKHSQPAPCIAILGINMATLKAQIVGYNIFCPIQVPNFSSKMHDLKQFLNKVMH